MIAAIYDLHGSTHTAIQSNARGIFRERKVTVIVRYDGISPYANPVRAGWLELFTASDPFRLRALDHRHIKGSGRHQISHMKTSGV